MNKGQLVPIAFDMANKTMTAPDCGALPVFHGEGHFISCWQLTDEQIQDIVDNRRIWLGIHANGQPQVWLSTDYPFQEQGDWPEDLEKKNDEQG